MGSAHLTWNVWPKGVPRATSSQHQVGWQPVTIPAWSQTWASHVHPLVLQGCWINTASRNWAGSHPRLDVALLTGTPALERALLQGNNPDPGNVYTSHTWLHPHLLRCSLHVQSIFMWNVSILCVWIFALFRKFHALPLGPNVQLKLKNTFLHIKKHKTSYFRFKIIHSSIHYS